MTIKKIHNESEGNKLEGQIFERIRRHVFMLYPFSDVKTVLYSVIDEKQYMDGIYIHLRGLYSDLIMRIPQYMLIKMVAQEFYNPFFEDNLRDIFNNYMKQEEEYKNNHAKGVELPAMKCKPCLHIFFKENKPTLLKRILGGLGL